MIKFQVLSSDHLACQCPNNKGKKEINVNTGNGIYMNTDNNENSFISLNVTSSTNNY